jgi:hypothetical protein
MTRPSRLELLGKFFPELKQPSSLADKEASLRFNTLACEAVLADQLHLFDNGFALYGPGVLCSRLRDGASGSEYLPLADLQSDYDQAKRANHGDVESFLADLIKQVESTNFERCGLIMLIDNSSMQVFPIDREYPARTIQAMLEEFAV